MRCNPLRQRHLKSFAVVTAYQCRSASGLRWYSSAPPQQSPKTRRVLFGLETDASTLLWGGGLLVLGLGSIYGTYYKMQRDERREQRRLERKETRDKIVGTVLDKFGNKTTNASAKSQHAAAETAATQEEEEEDDKRRSATPPTEKKEESVEGQHKAKEGVREKLRSLRHSKRPSSEE